MFTHFFHLKPIFVLFSVLLLIFGFNGTALAAEGSVGGAAQPIPVGGSSPPVGSEFDVILLLTNVSHSNETFPNVPPDPEVGIDIIVTHAEINFPSGAATFVSVGINGCKEFDVECVESCVADGDNRVLINLRTDQDCVLDSPINGVFSSKEIVRITLQQESPNQYIMFGEADYDGSAGDCEEANDGDTTPECSNAETRHDCEINTDCDYRADAGSAIGTANITPAICGDGIVGNTTNDNDQVETCDPVQDDITNPDPPEDCRPDGPDACTYCGDDIRQADEACDGPDNPDPLRPCNDLCEFVPICGDGIVGNTTGETCDPPLDPPSPDPNDGSCRVDCTFCGDGELDAGEQCDDGVDNSDTEPGACRTDCTLSECGDFVVDPDETCDPPGSVPDDNYPDNTCRNDETPFECTYCGDGIVQTGAGEACDFNASDAPPGCRTDCTLSLCGDGVVDPGETCDPPLDPPSPDPNDGSCRVDCTFCGDGELDAGEQCDDGNSNDSDACNNQCQPTTCAVDIIKESSCDGGPFGDGCITLETGNVRVRYTYENTGTADLFNCVITDTNKEITPDSESVTPDGSLIAADGLCSDLVVGGEPDTATIVCECFEDGSGITTQDQDESAFSCGTCGVDIIKESSCNGGPFGDGCSTRDTGTVQVRYRYMNTGTEDLINCTVDETNFEIPDITTPFDLPAGGSEVTDVRATDQCVTLFEGGEPDIATISCECVDMNGTLLEPVTDEDQSDFECLTCEVLVDRQVSCTDGQNYVDVGLAAGNSDGTEVCSTLEDGPVCLRYTAINQGNAPLANCMLTDDNGLLGIVNEPVVVTATESVIYEECFDMCIDVVDNEPGTAQLVCECFEQNSGEFTSDFDEAGFNCTQPPTGCRITGGGITPDTPSGNKWKSPGVGVADKSTFGGQVGASCGCIGCFDDLDHIKGHWTHNLKVEKGTFHASDFSSLVCNLDDREGPQPRKAPANSACFAGIGYLDMNQSRGNQRAAFRVEVEDRGEPGAGKNARAMADVYRIRVWIPEQGQEPEDLLHSICCLNADPLEVPEPDIDDGAELIHGNIQIHPVLPNTENERCPPPTPRTGECFDAAAGM